MRADQIGVIHVSVVQIALGLHLRLYRLHHVALAEQLVVHLNTGDLLKSLGERFRLILMRGNGFGDDVDLHTLKGFGSFDKPLHLRHLLFFTER